MTRGTEHDLMRLLSGELPEDEARQLRTRIRREPELAADFERLERTWTGLALPEPGPVPPGFSGRVMARVRSEASGISWTAAPAWVRAAAAVALLAGAALGLGLGRSLPASEGVLQSPAVSSAADEDGLSLAESYWTVVDEETGR